jgi:uncharacterized protein (TIGR02118 family)
MLVKKCHAWKTNEIQARENAFIGGVEAGGDPPPGQGKPSPQQSARGCEVEQKTSLSDRIVLRFPTVSLVEHFHREPSESEDGMIKQIVLWNAPEDPVAFERHYRDVYIPLVKQLLGLRRYTIGHHATELRGGKPYYWIAELEWDSMDALQKAFQSPQGQATAQEVDSLARSTGTGFRSMAYEVEEV